MSSREQKWTAIVCGGVDYGDNDRIIRLLSPTEGRCAILARGIRASKKSAKRALFEHGTVAEFTLRLSKGNLPTFREGQPIFSPKSIRTNLDALAAMTYGLELCSELAPEHHEAQRLFQLAKVWLELLETESSVGHSARQALEAKALTFAGFAPSLIRCAVSGEPIEDPVVFHHETGGATGARHGRGIAVAAAELKRLEAFRRTPMASCVGVRPCQPLWLLSDFAQWRLGKGLKSRAWLEEISP